MLKLLRSRTLPVVGLVFALTQPALADSARDALTLDDLREGSASSLVANDAFLPAEDSKAAETGFNGVLKLSATEMQMEPALSDREVMGRDAQIFPGLALEFFTHEGDLVHLTQDVITPYESNAENSCWQIIVQPGKTCSETGDDGWSRASFPIALMNRL